MSTGIVINRTAYRSDNWATPPYVYDELNARFDFNFDPCPLKHDITLWDGLEIEWKERNFINPPYSVDLKTKFILKAVKESKKGKLCVMLLPVIGTSTKLFHDIILQNITEPIRFWERRIKFIGYNSKGELVSNKSPMHDSMVVVFDGQKTSNNE